MGQAQGGVIARLKPGGIAHELGLEVGDRIAAINGHRLQDLIDYRFHLADEVVEVSVLKKNGEEWLLDIEKDPDDDLGVGFTSQVFDGIKTCRNRCLFCFVEQMPRGMRPPLYVKDDDYRLSFLHGNFISLTNLSPEEMERIKGQRLSPLHISVHATDPGLRATMMGSPQAGRIMKQLQELIAAGIDLHAQVVLCPGLNDGPQLKRTVTELSGLWPGLRSLAVVPVGLTRHRQRLYPLRTFTREEARTIV
ncbi:MAG: PDZ domain-containing protein, partial [Firmicutes bacterium]|nr:PDZ domain-containing protein [Bacillota bacterium]